MQMKNILIHVSSGRRRFGPLEEAEIWEGSPEEEGFLRVRPWELQSGAGSWGGHCLTSVSLPHSQAWDKAPSLSPHPGRSLKGQGEESRTVGRWA